MKRATIYENTTALRRPIFLIIAAGIVIAFATTTSTTTTTLKSASKSTSTWNSLLPTVHVDAFQSPSTMSSYPRERLIHKGHKGHKVQNNEKSNLSRIHMNHDKKDEDYNYNYIHNTNSPKRRSQTTHIPTQLNLRTPGSDNLSSPISGGNKNPIGNVFIGNHPNSKRRRAAKTLTSFFTKSTNSDTSSSSSASSTSRISILEQENDILRRTIAQLENENETLERSHAKQRIVLEQFEGEGQPMFDINGDIIASTWWEQENENDGQAQGQGQRYEQPANGDANKLEAGSGATVAVTVTSAVGQACEDYDDGSCPIEPDLSFKSALKDRAAWLVGLLTLQSMSGFILARNEDLLHTHPVIVYFLTMLVGAGGNAGNQAAVRVIRGIALGTLNENTQRQFLNRELKMAFALSIILSCAGFVRAIAFRTPLPETVAITSALALIVFTSICFGAVLPLLLRKIGVDPAHSSTTIQVIMDILGVVLTVYVSTTILDTQLGQNLIMKLTGGVSI